MRPANSAAEFSRRALDGAEADARRLEPTADVASSAPQAGDPPPGAGPDEFLQALARSDLRAALASLQRMTGCRYVGVTRVVAGQPELVVLHDRDRPATIFDTCPAALRDCSFVRDDSGRLVWFSAASSTASRDPDAEATAACSALPLLDPEGLILGTLGLCDDAGKTIAPIEFERLVQAASALSQHLAGLQAGGDWRTAQT